MARSRVVKPDFWNDEKLAKVSREARLTFIGLWTTSDDYGVTKGHPFWLKSQIYPYDEDLKLDKFVSWLKELEQQIMIIPFDTHQERYYFIRTFKKHQKVDKPSICKNPDPPPDILERVASESRDSSDETETETETETEKNTLAQKFDQFWAVYPKRRSKGRAQKAFNRINPSELLLAKMLATIEKARTSGDWMKEGGKFIPYPETWLNAEGWEDEILATEDRQKHDSLYQEYLAARQATMEKYKSSLDIDGLRAKFRDDWLKKDPNYPKIYQDWQERLERHFQHKLAGYIQDNFDFPSFDSWKKERKSHAMVR